MTVPKVMEKESVVESLPIKSRKLIEADLL